MSLSEPFLNGIVPRARRLCRSLSLSVLPRRAFSFGGALRRGRPLPGRRAGGRESGSSAAAGGERDFCSSSDLLPSFEDRLSTCDRQGDRATMGRPPPGRPPRRRWVRAAGQGGGRRRPISLGGLSRRRRRPMGGRLAGGRGRRSANGRGPRSDQTKIRANQSGVEAAPPTVSRRRARPRPQTTRPPDPSPEDRRRRPDLCRRRRSHSAPVARAFKTEERSR